MAKYFENYSPETSDLSLEISTTLELCELVNSARSLAVFLLLDAGEFSQYIALDIDPSHYDVHPWEAISPSFKDDYLVTKVMSKSPNIPLGIDRRQVALDSFFESERDCLRTNEVLSVAPVLAKEQKVVVEVKKILGKLSKHDLTVIARGFRHGSGATTGVSGAGSVISDKYDEEIHLTHKLLPFYRAIVGSRWREQASARIVTGNKFTTVPKSAKTDRGICIEPTLNIYCQLGVGAILKDRLLTAGCDLTDQTRNREGARLALSKGFATIDLSRASDTLAYMAVKRLLPPDWFHLLDLMRCESTDLGDETQVELSKFSSMGNGYTFELESLIFLSICKSVVPSWLHSDVTVYGDDIIVPQQYANEVIDMLNYFGLSVNREKSFLAGSFFESCGSDWFRNQPVRPFFLKGKSETNLPYILQIANKVRLYSSTDFDGEYCDGRFKPLWLRLLSRIPRDFRRCRVPPELGDTGVITSIQEASFLASQHGEDGVRVNAIKVLPKKRRKTTHGRLLEALTRWGLDQPTNGFEPVRGYLGRPSKCRVFVRRWHGLSWI